MATTGGLLRLPQFVRSIFEVVRSEQLGRDTTPPVLLNDQANITDLFATLGLAVALFALRFLLHKKVFPRLFAAYPKPLRSKLSENLFYATCHTIAVIVYVFVVRPSVDWGINLFRNDADIIKALVHPMPPPMTVQEHIYYIQACGFYVSALAFLMIIDNRRSDFQELFIHHIVTIGLIGVSYAYGYVRVGIIVVALHDIGDVFLYSAKFVHYLGYAGVDTAIFAVFAITFYVTRLLMYPRIVHAVTVDTMRTVVKDPSFNQWALYFNTYLWHYAFFVVFLGTLLILHCFWFALILKMIYRELFLGVKISETGDIRSDDEGEEEESNEVDEDDDFFDDPKKQQ